MRAISRNPEGGTVVQLEYRTQTVGKTFSTNSRSVSSLAGGIQSDSLVIRLNHSAGRARGGKIDAYH